MIDPTLLVVAVARSRIVIAAARRDPEMGASSPM
jgi:hypothetical protein